MSALNPGLISEFKNVVGDRWVITDPTELLVYETDALAQHRRAPDAVVLPRTTEEVSSIMRLCHEHGVLVVARGAGTGLSGGAVPIHGGIIIGLSRMKSILDIDYANRTATMEAGATNLLLSDHTTQHGYHFAPDPSSQAACSMGGNVAENAGGPHCLKTGVTANHVLGIEVVLFDGEVVNLGAEASEPLGYDLLGLFIGSEGTFGIATKITLKLERLPQGLRTLKADFMTTHEASQAVSDIIADGIIPTALEFIDHRSIEIVEASVLAAGYPTDAAAVLVIEIDGLEASLDDQAERITRVCKKNNARSVALALDDEERLKLWKGRKGTFGALGRMNPDIFVQDAVIPRTKLAEVLEQIYEICDGRDITMGAIAHAGDGNLHPNVTYDGRIPGERERVEEAMKEIMNVCIEAGGTITGEHGVGADKIGHMARIFDSDSLELMASVRRVWDPDRRLNPGKVVPEPDAA
jgi:glycolate oxidase subunit GlcD